MEVRGTTLIVNVKEKKNPKQTEKNPEKHAHNL